MTLSHRLIDWDQIAQDLNLREAETGSDTGYSDQAESLIHELAHVFDCIGEKAFQKRPLTKYGFVDDLISKTYMAKFAAYPETDWAMEADLSEVRVSAITLLTLRLLGIDREERWVGQDMIHNLRRGSWFTAHTHWESLELLSDMLECPTCKLAAETLYAFLVQPEYQTVPLPKRTRRRRLSA